MTTSRHHLPARRFTITVDQQIRDHGTVAYQITSKQFHGLILVEPWTTDDPAIPTRLWSVNLGEGSGLADQRTGLPVVRGITVYGGAGPVDLADPRWTSGLRLFLRPRGWASTRQHTAGEADLYAVMNVVAELHRQLDLAPLMLAAAKATADRRLRECVHSLLHTYQMFTEVRDDLRATTALADQLQRLSAIQLLGPEPVGRWHGCVDPDVYLRADDDGDWLVCPSCHDPITCLDGGDRLGSLLNEVARHRCR